MKPCACSGAHPTRRVALTGGPGAGKTAVLELVRRSLCEHVVVLPESASVVFGGGFPRTNGVRERRAAQRAIFYVQRELESAGEAGRPAVVLCDRGTIDGAAYWPGPDTLWSSVRCSREDELARYDAVIHLRVPSEQEGYDHVNALRIESALEAGLADLRIEREWDGHPRRSFVEADPDFVAKISRALELLRAEVPECCGGHFVPARPTAPRFEVSEEVPA